MPDVEELRVGMSLDASGVETGAQRAEKALEGVADTAEQSGERSASGISEINRAILVVSRVVREKMKEVAAALTDSRSASKQAADGVKETAAALKDTNYAAKISSSYMKMLSESMTGLADRKRQLENEGKGLGFTEYDHIIQDMAQIKQMQAEYRRNLTQPTTVNVDASQLDNLSNKLKLAQDELKSLSDAGLGFGIEEYDRQYQEVVRLTQAVRDYKAELKRLAEQPPSDHGVLQYFAGVAKGFGLILAGVGEAAGQAFSKVSTAVRSKLVSGLQMAGKGIANVAGRLLSMSPGVSIIRGIADRLRGVKSGGDGASGGLARMVRQIRNINIAGMAMRGVTLLFGRLRSVVQEYLSQNQAAQNAVNALKSAFANALAPAINIAINALNAMLPVIQAISNAFATLVTNLFGAQWTTISGASGAASAVSGVADATRDAAAAQKEYNNEVYGFDQITKQSDNSSGSGGSGGGGGGGSGGTSTSTIGGGAGMLGQFKEFFEEVSKLFKNGEWANLGTYLAESFGSAIDTAYNFLTSKAVYDRVESAVDAFSTTVNSFFERLTLVDDATGNSIAGKTGETIGAAINLAFYTVNSTLTSIDWGNIGLTIAQTINGAVKETDWSQIGETIANWFLVLPKTLYSVIVNTDWAAVGKGISDMIMSALRTVNDWLSTVDWAEIGHSVADFLLSIDWVGIAGEIITFFVGAFSGLGLAIVTAIGDIGPSVGKAFSDLWDSVSGRDPNKGLVKTVDVKATIDASMTPEGQKNVGQVYGLDGKTTNTTAKTNWAANAKEKVDAIIGLDGKTTNTTANVGLNQRNWTNVGAWVSSHAGNAVNKAVGLAKNKWTSLQTYVNSNTGGAVNKIVGLTKNHWTSLQAYVSSNTGGAVNKPVGVTQGWKGSLQTALGLANAAISVKAAVSKKLGASDLINKNSTVEINATTSGASKSTKQLATIKFAARGGILDAATFVRPDTIGGEAGREALLPLEHNTEWMDTWARKAASAVVQMLGGTSGGSGGRPMVVQVVMPDGRVLGETVVDYLHGEANQGRFPLANMF